MKKTTLAAAIAALTVTAPAMAYEAGDLILRVGYAEVVPDESSVVPGLGDVVSVDDGSAVGITASYMLSSHVGIELLAATPFNHDISVTGIGKVAETDHLPPTVNVQFYPMGAGSKFQPYVGLGLNYTVFFSEDTEPGIGGSFDLDSSWGLAGEAGFDVQINDNWVVNAAVWRMYISTDTTFEGGALDGVSVDVDLNPWAYMVSVGYKF